MTNPPPKAGCECLTSVNEQLRKHNTRVATGLQIQPDMSVRKTVLVATEKVDKASRKPAVKLSASFCPFCGLKVPT